MDFTFYDVSFLGIYEADSVKIEDLRQNKEEFDWVQNGLSGGEARQALLDRFKSDIEDQEFNSIKITLSQFNYEIDEENFYNEKSLKNEIAEIDELLYTLENEELVEKLWIFENEVLLLDLS